ncbi:UDP-N-acetylglucosamine 2-epimerase [Lysobacter sp. MMG2]|uniref:UDP-N-acetylglucosamine 2-epimerase n=1 Tax=Lysobacter sp. MMG2 TaxID=2801338 RepID=UPI001C214628|nr:UDP-N-acetylglucosamine 2-epimerase [Lysobacter sp. MMG2]MBU8978072.1 UDP-N-acetylglucosamine 2-epimerase [Lysobacter sp. MMG2]
MRDPKLVAASAIALAVTLFAIFAMRPWARKIGLVDRPDSRKQHRGSIPLIGGLCFFLGTLVGLSYLGYIDGFVTSLLAGGVMIVAAGALDDASNLSVTTRLLVEAGAAGLVIFMSGFYVHDLGEIVGTRHIEIGLFGIPFTIIAVIGLINAFNMMDGIDGLAASMAMVCIGAILLFDESPWSMPGVLLMLQVLFAALIPYFFVNMGWPDGRKVFMGDAGSTLIGFILAWSLIYMSHGKVGRLNPPDVLWCVALPVMDTLAVMYRRLRAGGSPFRADRQHLHHLLCDTGMPPRLVLLSMVAIAGLLVLMGYGLRNLPQSLGFAAFMLVLALHVWWVPKVLTQLRGRWPRSAPRPAPAAPLHAPTNHGISFLAALARFDDHEEARPDVPPARAGISLPDMLHRAEPSSELHAVPLPPMRALCVLSDSPDAVRMAPIARQLALDERFETTVCVATESGRESSQVLELFDLAADAQFGVPPASGDPADITSSALGGIKRVMTQVRPDLVVVTGDAPATLAATLAAHYHQVPVVCIDGGLAHSAAPRSADDPGRRIARALAALHVASGQSAGRRLVAEGVPAHRVLVTGDAAPDALRSALERLQPDIGLGRELSERFDGLREGRPLVLLLGDEVGEAHTLLMCDALHRLARERPDIDVVCAVGPLFFADTPPNLHRIDTTDYLTSLFLLGRARLAFVGPSLHAEALALDVPLLALEPPAVEAHGRVHLMSPDAEAITDHVLRLLDEAHVPPPRAALDGSDDDGAVLQGDADARVADALAGLRPAAHAVPTAARDAGSPNQTPIRRAWSTP